ncbi:hypothetical protein Smic_65460 [Streptomyces microflavus]|uniref:Uncharacterized protein n=1 Tax=Streptomyces microflavus TaxID=1919 RepID=A0A7J0CZS0_STRMI|nr:hypothetical protein Smic_65460 [Streptomyces microflavus]
MSISRWRFLLRKPQAALEGIEVSAPLCLMGNVKQCVEGGVTLDRGGLGTGGGRCSRARTGEGAGKEASIARRSDP